MKEYTVIGFGTSVQNIEVSRNTAKAWELSQIIKNHPCMNEGNRRDLGWLEEPLDIQVCKVQRGAVPRLEGKKMQFCSPRPSPWGPAVDTSWGQKERFHGWAGSAGMWWCQISCASPHPAWWEPREVSVPSARLRGMFLIWMFWNRTLFLICIPCLTLWHEIPATSGVKCKNFLDPAEGRVGLGLQFPSVLASVLYKWAFAWYIFRQHWKASEILILYGVSDCLQI